MMTDREIRSSQLPAWICAGALALTAIALLSLWFYLRWNHPIIEADARALAIAAQYTEAGRSMYEPLPAPGPHRMTHHYLYPPVFAPLLSLVSDPANPATAQRVIFILCGIGLLAFGVSVTTLANSRGPARIGIASAIVLVGLWWYPARWLLQHGNIDAFLWGMTTAGFVLPLPVGMLLLTTAGALKVTPGWAALVLAIREPRARMPLVLTATGLLILSAIVVGPVRLAAEWGTWVTDVVPTLAQGQFEIGRLEVEGRLDPWLTWALQGNLSPVFAPLYLLGDPYPSELPAWARLYLTVASTGIPLLVAWRTRHLEGRQQAVIVLGAAVLSAPIFRLGYLPLVLPGALVLVQSHRRRSPARAPIWAAEKG